MCGITRSVQEKGRLIMFLIKLHDDEARMRLFVLLAGQGTASRLVVLG